MFDEDSMPVNCERCNKVFDLPDGCPSRKWYPDTTICRNCAQVEEEEIDREEEIHDWLETYHNAKYDLKEARQKLKRLGYDLSEEE